MNEDILIPEFMPVLTTGKHSDPANGACIMEYVSIIAGERFSDHPMCVHPKLAEWARLVNDRLPDSKRHLLVPLIGRFIGTSRPLPHHVEVRLDAMFNMHQALMGATCACCTWGLDWSSERYVEWLTKGLDIYDQITGRTGEGVHEDDVRAAGELVAEAQAEKARRKAEQDAAFRRAMEAAAPKFEPMLPVMMYASSISDPTTTWQPLGSITWGTPTCKPDQAIVDQYVASLTSKLVVTK